MLFGPSDGLPGGGGVARRGGGEIAMGGGLAWEVSSMGWSGPPCGELSGTNVAAWLGLLNRKQVCRWQTVQLVVNEYLSAPFTNTCFLCSAPHVKW